MFFAIALRTFTLGASSFRAGSYLDNTDWSTVAWARPTSICDGSNTGNCGHGSAAGGEAHRRRRATSLISARQASGHPRTRSSRRSGRSAKRCGAHPGGRQPVRSPPGGCFVRPVAHLQAGLDRLLAFALRTERAHVVTLRRQQDLMPSRLLAAVAQVSGPRSVSRRPSSARLRGYSSGARPAATSASPSMPANRVRPQA